MQKWEPDTWATGMSALLQGKALDVYALMPKEDALNYEIQAESSTIKEV